MKKILLHVGTHKTGSTSIQQTLHRNRDILEKHDIHYLEFGSNHWHVYSAFMNNPWNWFEHRRMNRTKQDVVEMNRETLHSLREEITNSSANNIIISSEYLCQLPRGKIIKLRDYLADLGDTTVVYFCRNIISWLSSDSQQCAKVGMKTQPTSFDVAIKRLIDFPENYISAFDRKQFVLIRFEDAIKEGLCNTILEIGNLPKLEDMNIEEVVENKSISSESVRCFFALNKAYPLFDSSRSRMIGQILEKIPGSKYQIPPCFLSQEEVDDLNQKMEDFTSNYGIPLYDKMEHEESDDPSLFFSDEAIDYLVDTINRITTQNQRLIREKKDYLYNKRLAKSLEISADKAASQKRTHKAIELYLLAIEHGGDSSIIDKINDLNPGHVKPV